MVQNCLLDEDLQIWIHAISDKILILKKSFEKHKIRFSNQNMQDMKKTSECEYVCLNKFYKFEFTYFLIRWIFFVAIFELKDLGLTPSAVESIFFSMERFQIL